MRYPYFHATVPSDAFMSKVLTALVDHFGWQKVAILSTHDEHSVLVIKRQFDLTFNLFVNLGFTDSG